MLFINRVIKKTTGMKKNNFKIVLLVLLFFGLNKNLISQDKDYYLIDSVNYYAMLDGYCAMTALQMNLDYYGFKIDQSLLLNLGWNYGFMYLKTPFYTIAYPDTDPVEEIVFACNHIGFKATVLIHKTLKESRETIVKYISQDIPVLIQWTPHTILAYGYKDSANVVIYNDPGDFRNQSVDIIDKIPFGKGENISMPISDWEKMPYLWGMRQYQIVVIEPKDKTININWKVIWKRNAEKTLGSIKNQFQTFFGIDGMNEIIKDLNEISGKNISKCIEIIKNYEMCFKLGIGFRRDAAAFLAGQASTMIDNNLRLASIEFMKSAQYFHKGYNLIDWFNNNYEQKSGEQAISEFIEIFEKIVECEIEGSTYLLKALK